MPGVDRVLLWSWGHAWDPADFPVASQSATAALPLDAMLIDPAPADTHSAAVMRASALLDGCHRLRLSTIAAKASEGTAEQLFTICT